MTVYLGLWRDGSKDYPETQGVEVIDTAGQKHTIFNHMYEEKDVKPLLKDLEWKLDIPEERRNKMLAEALRVHCGK